MVLEKDMYCKNFKRVFDVGLSITSIFILLIPMIIVAIAIKLESKGSSVFKQERIGQNNTKFTIYKFRSMSIDTPKDVPTHLLGEANSHITKVGSFIRKTSLDELPQLFCILKGDMSFVGPRPCLPNQIDLITLRDENGASALKPGLTGLAQINGRDELEIDIKAKLDGEYVQKISFLFDLKCLIMTGVKVLKKDGVKEGV